MEHIGVGWESDLKAAGAELLHDERDGRRGLRLSGWQIHSCNRPILSSLVYQEWEEKLGTLHLPEMVFGESSLCLLHVESGIKLHFNAFDALKGWKQEALPPVEVPAAAKWKFRSNPLQQVRLDYDYTFTTPYCGSEAIESNQEKITTENESCSTLCWEDCNERIDPAALSSREPILFYDEVVLYEDELADNGVSLLTVKVRVMPSCWFLLLRFWLRVGVLMRLRDTRVYCAFGDCSTRPVILRENCWREATFKSLSAKGFSSDSAAYGDPNDISQRLPIIRHQTQRLNLSQASI